MYPLPDLSQSSCQAMIPLWVILILYIFWALALVCEMGGIRTHVLLDHISSSPDFG